MENPRNKESLLRDTQSLCFYGTEFSSPTVENFFSAADALIRSFGWTFDRMLFTEPRADKSATMKYNLHKMIDCWTKKEYVCVGSMKTWKTGWKSDYSILAMISKSCAIITFAEFDFVLDLERSQKSLIEFASLLNSPYSVFYDLPYNKSAYLYSVGIGAGFIDQKTEVNPDKKKQNERFYRWGWKGIPEKVWWNGYIRDVYPINIICEQQAYHMVNGKRFVELVSEKVIPGEIKKVNNLFLWTVPYSKINDTRVIVDGLGMIMQ